MKTTLLVLASSLIIILASGLTFLDLNRYGTHGDSVPCGENKRQETFYTASSYLLMTQTYPESEVNIGTCPYENFSAKTYALDLWIPAIILSIVSYKRISRRSSRPRKDPSI